MAKRKSTPRHEIDPLRIMQAAKTWALLEGASRTYNILDSYLRSRSELRRESCVAKILNLFGHWRRREILANGDAENMRSGYRIDVSCDTARGPRRQHLRRRSNWVASR